MLSKEETVRRSKMLSLILRHDPARVGIVLDAQGWTDVATLLTQLKAHKKPLSFKQLVYLVEANAKQRFRFSDDRSRIRASQGHSVEVELGYTPVAPPEVLYHGTAVQHQSAIVRDGLQKMSRHHVHLSADVATARTVGSRHGRLVLFEVAAGAMHRAGHAFYQADNGVWLTDEVSPTNLRLLPETA